MAGIVIPRDRTDRQQARGYCLNPQCREDSAASLFEFPVDHDHYACPKCGNDQPPGVGLLVLTHLLVPDPKGPIRSGIGQRFRFACDAKRVCFATPTNQEAVTGMPEFTNCMGCLNEIAKLGITNPQGADITANDAA